MINLSGMKQFAKATKSLNVVAGFLNKDEGLGRRLMGGAWWLALGAGVSSGATLASSVLLARILGIAEFGNYTILVSTLGVVLILAGPSIGWTSSKYVSEYRYTNPEKATRIIALTNLMALGFSLAFALVMVIGAGFITRTILKLPAIRLELMVASVAVLFTGINGAQRGTLAGFQNFRAVALINAIQGVLLVLLLFPLVRPYGIMGAVIAQSAAVAGSCVVGTMAIRREMRRLHMPRLTFPMREDLSILGGFTVPSYLISIAAMLSSWIVGVLVVRGPQGSYEMGIFGIATQVFLTCMFFPTMVGQPCLPILSEQLQHRDEKQASIRRLLLFMVALSFFITLALAMLVLLWGHSVLGVFGKGLDGYYSLLVVTILSALLAASLGPLNYYMSARGDMWLALGLSIVGIIANIGLVLLLRGSGAAASAVWGRFASYVIITPILLAYVTQTLNKAKQNFARNRALPLSVS